MFTQGHRCALAGALAWAVGLHHLPDKVHSVFATKVSAWHLTGLQGLLNLSSAGPQGAARRGGAHDAMELPAAHCAGQS